MRAAIAAALVVILLLVVVAAEARQSRSERRMRVLINRTRDNYGLPELRPGWRLNRYAERHAERMADAGQIFHSSRLRCYMWGENVGAIDRQPYAILQLHWAFMRSSAHQANILNPVFRRIGVGVVPRDGILYVAVVFVKGRCQW